MTGQAVWEFVRVIRRGVATGPVGSEHLGALGRILQRPRAIAFLQIVPHLPGGLPDSCGSRSLVVM